MLVEIKSKFVFTSLLLHVLGYLLMHLNSDVVRNEPIGGQKSLVYEIQIQDSSKTTPSVKNNPQAIKKSNKNSATKNIKISNLVPKYKFNGKYEEGAVSKVAVEKTSAKLEESIEASFNEARSMGLAEATEYMPSFRAISKKIEKTLAYPDDLQKTHRYGKFQVYFKVNKQGQIQNSIRVSKADELLLGYTLLVLKESLQEALPDSLHFDKAMLIAAEFNFQLKVDESFIKGERQRELNFKNYLSFNRQGRVDNKFKQWTREVLWRKIPPIVPFPGGVMVDLQALYYYIKDYGKALPGELRQYRLDHLKGKIQRDLASI